MWKIQTGECLHIIRQGGIVEHVSFSPINPQHIISISSNRVQQWDVNGHQILPTYDGVYFDFSPDHTQFALCNGKVITIQNSDSGAIVAEFHVADGHTTFCHFSPDGHATFCCFSPDGRLVAAAASCTAYVWDITMPHPHLIETFVGHTKSIISLVFSSPSTLISASADELVKFWKIGVSSADPGTTPLTLPPIQSISLQARAGIVISCDEDGVVKTWDIITGLCKATFQIPAIQDIDIDNSDVKLIDGRLIFICDTGDKIHIWDTEREELLQTLDILDTTDESDSSDPLYYGGLRISGDGSKVLYLYNGTIQAWSMWTWEPVGKVKLGLGRRSHLDSLCMDGSRVWFHSEYPLAQEGWDFGISGSSPVPFDPSIGRPCLEFIGGASWQTHGPSWIKDTTTGKEVFQLSGRYVEPSDVQWDGQYLAAGYESGEVLILDFHHVLSRDM